MCVYVWELPSPSSRRNSICEDGKLSKAGGDLMHTTQRRIHSKCSPAAIERRIACNLTSMNFEFRGKCIGRVSQFRRRSARSQKVHHNLRIRRYLNEHAFQPAAHRQPCAAELKLPFHTAQSTHTHTACEGVCG